jgi:hypothetical protein
MPILYSQPTSPSAAETLVALLRVTAGDWGQSA